MSFWSRLSTWFNPGASAANVAHADSVVQQEPQYCEDCKYFEPFTCPTGEPPHLRFVYAKCLASAGVVAKPDRTTADYVGRIPRKAPKPRYQYCDLFRQGNPLVQICPKYEPAALDIERALQSTASSNEKDLAEPKAGA